MSLVLQIPPHLSECLRLCASISKGTGLISGFRNKQLEDDWEVVKKRKALWGFVIAEDLLSIVLAGT